MHGRVHGVGFRYTVMQHAERFPNVSGTVRNLRDGSVEVDAEGEEQDVDALLDAVVRNPPFMARVDSVEQNVAPLRGLTGFGVAPDA